MNLFNFFKSSSPAHNEIAENGADKVLSSEEENPSVHKAYVNFPTSRKSALDVPLYAISSGRSERPKNGADAQPCLSDVYKNGTRAKRRQADVYGGNVGRAGDNRGFIGWGNCRLLQGDDEI